ncbi:MAG: cupin domain-containing protein [Halieaceae bacterium]|nr:cupin domain-containing protein [Halieaceae bacterium]
MNQLAGFNQAQFLRDTWQQKPLLIRGAVDALPTLSPEELAGLALEPDVAARLVVGAEPDWSVDTGPFDARSFASEGPWSLLVEAVDHYLPEVAELRSLLPFLPSWRFDDIMVSYATDGGGVGPHFDHYDVFLLQGMGKRRWQIGQACTPETPQRDAAGLRLLEHFELQEEYLLEPGDILYLPPGRAHWGIADGPCMTYSLGFRSPRLRDLIARQLDSLLETMGPDLFFVDATPSDGAARPGEITDLQIAAARAQVAAALTLVKENGHWFGELVTEPGHDPLVPAPSASLPRVLRLDPASRLAWSQAEDGLTVYANGERCTPGNDVLDLVISLCAGSPVDCEHVTAAERAFLEAQWRAGLLVDE